MKTTTFGLKKPTQWILLAGLLVVVPAFAQGGRGGAQGGGRGGQNGQMGGGRGGNRGQMRDQMLKMQLNAAGLTDTTMQEAVVAYVKTKESGRQKLYDAANALSEALSDEESTDAEIDTLYDAFNSALQAEKVRVAAAEKTLDGQIKFNTNKRLKAALTLSGVIGDAMSYLNSGGGRGMGGPGLDGPPPPRDGRGGPGGGMGGPMDGPPPPRDDRGGPGMDGPPPPRDGRGGPGMDGPPPPPFDDMN